MSEGLPAPHASDPRSDVSVGSRFRYAIFSQALFEADLVESLQYVGRKEPTKLSIGRVIS